MAASRDPGREAAAASARQRFDHVLVAVFDLAAAKAEFESLGFTVTPGGQHFGGLTENALVTFVDGNYLELIAPTRRELLEHPRQPGPGNYLFLFDSGEGFAGYAFDPPNLNAEVERVRSNGAVGVVGTVIPVEDLERAVAWHEVLLGVASTPGLPGLRAATADFHIGGFRLKLAAPESEASPMAEYLARRGPVPYQVHIRTTSPQHVANLEARGAPIELVRGGASSDDPR